MRDLRNRVIPVLFLGSAALLAWACGGSNDNNEGDGAADSPFSDGPAADGGHDSGPEGSVEDGPHDGGHDVFNPDGGSDVGPDVGSDVGSDVGPSDSGHDAGHDADHEAGFDAGHDAGFDAGPPDVGPPPDAPPFDAGIPVTIATHESPTTLAADDSYVYWVNSADAVLDCPVAGCPSNTPTILGFNGEGFGLQTIAAGDTTAFYIDSSDNIDSCAGAGCSLAPAIYEGTTDGGFSSYESVITDSVNAYFTDGTSVFQCALGTACTSPITLYTDTTAEVGALAVSATSVFWVREGSFAQTIRSVPIGGGTSIKVCGSTFLDDAEDMVATSQYVYFTTGDDPSSIYQCPVLGGSPEVYTSDLGPYGLATDGTYLYWTNDITGGTVAACGAGPSCAASFTIATGQDFPTAIAVNSTSVFWGTSTAIYSALR